MIGDGLWITGIELLLDGQYLRRYVEDLLILE